MKRSGSNGGWRGSPELWIEEAQRALLERGVEAVKIQPLAERLKLSRTSFYWFFKDRDELLDALLLRWRDKNTGNLIKQTEAYAESVAEAMLNVIDCWLNPALFDQRFEIAVRSWAMHSEKALAEVRRADRERIDAFIAMFVRFGEEAQLADVRANTTYQTQMGYISMQVEEDLPTRIVRAPMYTKIFTGVAPEPRELARFHARHGYKPE